MQDIEQTVHLQYQLHTLLTFMTIILVINIYGWKYKSNLFLSVHIFTIYFFSEFQC